VLLCLSTEGEVEYPSTEFDHYSKIIPLLPLMSDGKIVDSSSVFGCRFPEGPVITLVLFSPEIAPEITQRHTLKSYAHTKNCDRVVRLYILVTARPRG